MTTTWSMTADGQPVMDTPAAPTPPATPQQIAEAGWTEGAQNMLEQQYRQQSQRNLENAVAASRAAEGGPATVQPTGETLPAPVTDGLLPVAAVRQTYSDSPSAEARQYLENWHGFDADLPVIQRVAGEMRRSMGEQSWGRLSEAFDNMSDREQLEIMWSLSRQGTPSPGTFTNTNRNEHTMTTPTVPAADLDAAIEAADLEFDRAYDSRNRIKMAAADQKRAALYAQKYGTGPVVGSQLRNI